jgi:hypothetical protein
MPRIEACTPFLDLLASSALFGRPLVFPPDPDAVWDSFSGRFLTKNPLLTRSH